MIDAVIQAISWAMTGFSLLGKGMVAQIPHKIRMWGFLLLIFTGAYWSYQLYLISQWQMMSMQVIMAFLNIWGFINGFRETYVEKVI